MDFDVLIAGGGPAGIAASIAAARNGARTLLVERYGCVGGAFTNGMHLTPVGFEPFKFWAMPTDPATWAVQGIAREVHDRMVAEGAVQKPVWDPETFKLLADDMLSEAGVQVAYHATAAGVLMESGRVAGVSVATKRGLEHLRARVTVDCTGDGDLFAWAGGAFEKGRPEDGKPQPMTLSTVFGRVKLPYAEDATYAQMMALSPAIVGPALTEGVARGAIPPVFPGIMFPRVVRGGGILRDQVWCRLIQFWGDPVDPADVSRAESEARRSVRKVLDFLRAEVPGFEEAVLLQTAIQVWPRESRRLTGLATLTEQDVRTNAKYDDAIARGTCFLDLHPRQPDERPGQPIQETAETMFFDDIDYDIRYGCLVPEAVEGLLVAGRCISATHVAQSSSRMQATCMALGQAAGAAAAVASASGKEPRELDPVVLRRLLRAQGAAL